MGTSGMLDRLQPLIERGKRWLERVTPFNLTIGCSAFSLIAMILAVSAAYSTSEKLPPPGPPPPRPETSAVTTYRYLPTFYRSLVEEDIARLKLGSVTVAQLARGNAYRSEFTGRQTLRPGGKLETRTLRLRALSRKMWVGGEGRRFRSNHLLLQVKNKTKRHVAYRVVTAARGACGAKAVLAQNAIALRPGGSVERSECLGGRRARLRILSVEVLELTPLGYHYVSRLDPRVLQLPPRIGAGHEPGELPLCRVLPWQAIKRELTEGDTKWHDVVDFYSRHNCDEYSFFPGYRWAPGGPAEKLPLRPPERR
jgi:hypothetical protein